MSDGTAEIPNGIFDAPPEPPGPRPAPLIRPAPLRPMVFAALALIGGIVVGDSLDSPEWSLITGIGLILALSLGGLWHGRGAPEGRRPVHTGFLLFGVIFLFGWLRGGREADEDRLAESVARKFELQPSVRVEGIIATPPERREYGWRIVLKDVNLRGEDDRDPGVRFPLRLQVTVLLEVSNRTHSGNPPPWMQGERVAATGRIKRPQPASFPGDFDARLHLGSQGIGATMNVKGWTGLRRTGEPGKMARLLDVLRQMRESVNSTLGVFMADPRRAAIASALLIGERSGLPPALNEAFARTGLVHVLSVSGLHTGIVLALVLGVLRLFGPGPRTTAIIAITCLFFYTALTGFNPPVVRAALMGAFMMGGWLLGRHTSILSGLALSAFLTLMLDPRNLFRPDWQLSYLCVLSITVFAPPIYEMALPLSKPANPDGVPVWTRFFRQWIWLPFVVVLAVQIGLLPVQLHYFNRISLIGFLIQPLALALVGLCMTLGIAACAFAWMPPVAIAAGWLAVKAVLLFEQLVMLGGSPDWSVLDLPRMPGWMTVLYMASVFIGPHLLKGRMGMNQLDFHQRRSLVWRLVLILFFIAGLVWMPSRGGTKGILELYVVDVGQGDALVLRFPNGGVGLIDGGRGWSSGGTEPDISRFLRSLGVKRLDFMIATHADADHIGGLPSVLRHFKVGRFIHGPDTSNSDLFDELNRLLAVASFPVDRIQAGDLIHGYDPVTIEALNPLPGEDNNDASIALLVDYEDIEILLTGDIEASAEREIVKSGRARDVEVLKVPHHGSASSTTEGFLDAFQPEIALISVGRNNVYRHPSPRVTGRLEGRGILAARTDEMGTLLLRTDGRRMKLYSYGGSR